MAIPRIFISSTCYDLQEIRFQLRQFVLEFGYDPVMSEFDDIFYNYELHVQDSCIEEISKCQLFILVVGNNYGSVYHKDKEVEHIPDSVTLREFRRAIEYDIYKHIFINKFVDYDHKNYKRALDKSLLKYFKENVVPDEKTEEVKLIVKKQFDETYPFPYDSYKYVFYFLDIINELKEGNAISPFESFGDIKESLKKQWAGFMYESLSKKDKKLENTIKPLQEKISHIDSNIKKLLESKTITTDSKISFDIAKLTRDLNIENLEEVQNKIDDILSQIFCYSSMDTDTGEDYYLKKVWFSVKFDADKTKKWLAYIKELLNNYKWSKQINVKVVFSGFNLTKYNQYHQDVPYKKIFEIHSLYDSLPKPDKENFINTVMLRFNDAYDPPPQPKVAPSDDLPF